MSLVACCLLHVVRGSLLAFVVLRVGCCLLFAVRRLFVVRCLLFVLCWLSVCVVCVC